MAGFLAAAKDGKTITKTTITTKNRRKTITPLG